MTSHIVPHQENIVIFCPFKITLNLKISLLIFRYKIHYDSFEKNEDYHILYSKFGESEPVYNVEYYSFAQKYHNLLLVFTLTSLNSDRFQYTNIHY